MALILWSGGLDSSLVLLWCLQNWYGGQRGWPDHELKSAPHALTIENGQMHEGFQKKQEQAREKLKKKWERKGWKFPHHTIKIDSAGTYGGHLPQPTIWITQSALVIGENEQLYLGWIRGDDATANLSTIKKAWKVLTKLNGKGKSKLHLPLQFVSKYEVIKECKKEGIYKSCWWCENPTKAGRKCGQCECCLSMVAAEAILTQKGKKKKDSVEDVIQKIKGS